MRKRPGKRLNKGAGLTTKLAGIRLRKIKEIQEWRQCLFLAAGGQKVLIETFFDLRALKQADEQMKKAMEAAEAANRAKSESLANMAVRTARREPVDTSEYSAIPILR